MVTGNFPTVISGTVYQAIVPECTLVLNLLVGVSFSTGVANNLIPDGPQSQAALDLLVGQPGNGIGNKL